MNSMTDKELLELAAKAVEIELEGWCCYRQGFNVKHDPTIWWNPLTDDGDALRLAVKLGLCMTVDLNLGGEVEVWEYQTHDPYENVIINNDPYAATRRCIVLAAAEIGKTK